MEKELAMYIQVILNRHSRWRGIAAALTALALVSMPAACGGAPSAQRIPTPTLPQCNTKTAPAATAVPPGAPAEDICYATEWPAPNGNLYNTRVAHSTISSANVAKLKVAWTVPLRGKGLTGADVANPVIANGIAYLQDGASNVIAVRLATGQVLWKHQYNSADYGPNGVTIANGRIYGVTQSGVFALDAETGLQVWYDTQLAQKANFDMAPQVANGKVFVASALTPGGGIVYALDANTGATLWSFQTVVDPAGQKLAATAGGAWDPVLIGPDNSIYVGTGNPYLTLRQAQTTPSRELYTDSIVKLNQATGKVEWYYQAFPDDFHDWDLQISPIYTTTASGRPVVLAAGKGGFVFAFDAVSGQLLWKTSVGVHNGHDNDDEQALAGTLQMTAPYTLLPGEVGGVETDMAAADGVVYVPVVNVPTTYTSATSSTGTPDFTNGSGELAALDLATGKPLWTTALPAPALGGATVANDLVFTATLFGEVVALARQNGSIVWTAQLPSASNSPLAIVGDTLLAGVTAPQAAEVVAYRLASV
jgi:outer membrane protein assembly factor BamB